MKIGLHDEDRALLPKTDVMALFQQMGEAIIQDTAERTVQTLAKAVETPLDALEIFLRDRLTAADWQVAAAHIEGVLQAVHLTVDTADVGQPE